MTFGPKYPNFGVKKAHFRPQRPIGASMINVFNTKKVSHQNPDTRVPKFLLPAPKNWIFGPKTAKFGPKLAFWDKYRYFGPFIIHTLRIKCPLGSFQIALKTYVRGIFFQRCIISAYFLLCLLREGIKRRTFYGQADRKRLPPIPPLTFSFL